MPSIFGKSGSTAGAGRAKTRHQSIRGTISAPIPIPGTPDDDEFPIRNPGLAKASTAPDDEFPIRMPGAGIAMPLPPTDDTATPPEEPLEQLGGQQGLQTRERESSPDSSTEREQEQEQQREQENMQVPSPPSVSAGSGGSRTDLARPEPPPTPPPAPPTEPGTPVGRPSSRPASRSPSHRPSPRKSSPPGVSPARDSPPMRRATNPVLSTIRYSTISDAPTKHTTQSKDSPQRKKSSLRLALGRLFGRGKKKSGNGNQDGSVGSGRDSGRESRPLGSAQHRSDPTALSRPNQRSPKRSASLPMSEFDRPLRSHSIGPGDIMAIESARNSLQAEAVGPGLSMGASGRKRAVTAGGQMLLRSHMFNREWGAGLSPRPASAQGRASQAGGRDESDDPNEIGRAITSDSGGGLRRRSRSLSGLQDLAGVRPAGRRRSVEIRYWRESYNPGFMSPMSSNAQDDVDDAGMVDISAPESPAVERPPRTPPQPFNFGLLSKEMIGMKITHAADMDMRLGNVESRTHQLERVVDKLCHAVPGFKGAADPRHMTQPTSSQRSLEPDTHSQVSLAAAYTGPLQPPPSFTTKGPPPLTPATSRPPNQPTFNSTVRGAASLPILNRDGGSNHRDAPQDELITQLRTDLDAERAARKALEAQVKKLSERVNTLSTTMFAMIRGPSESRSHERLAPPSPSVGGSSPRLGTPKTLPVPLPRHQEQRSVFDETDDDADDAEALSGKKKQQQQQQQGSSAAPTKPDLEEGEMTEDDFQTPREERTPMMVGYGAFGEELRPDEDDHAGGDEEDDDDPKRKKAARTLSLGQLTLGKGQRTRT
ncbi:hypothetical protein C8A00DRAFT_34852 [Chaetomidium leptoderma]|uniref:Uncharacterized protein n=1 Tax=Chaetomidium leptoderma TaxID=669021 RepID=A0AAN6ZXG8_9PEZI|nr:hypothetical protein C8A00DRAFT_34852 [Chaetomidium leptoderma]